MAGPPEAVEGAGMLLATEPGSSNASTGAHALGPLTLPAAAHSRQVFACCCSARQRTRLDDVAVVVKVCRSVCIHMQSTCKLLDLELVKPSDSRSAGMMVWYRCCD